MSDQSHEQFTHPEFSPAELGEPSNRTKEELFDLIEVVNRDYGDDECVEGLTIESVKYELPDGSGEIILGHTEELDDYGLQVTCSVEKKEELSNDPANPDEAPRILSTYYFLYTTAQGVSIVKNVDEGIEDTAKELLFQQAQAEIRELNAVGLSDEDRREMVAQLFPPLSQEQWNEFHNDRALVHTTEQELIDIIETIKTVANL